MAKRKTLAETAAEAVLEKEAMYARQAEQYLPKLMAALEEATRKANYELTVNVGKFYLRDRDGYDSRREEVYLSPVYTKMNWDQLENLEWDLQMKAEARAEALRRSEVKQAALNKLSAEERELLGL